MRFITYLINGISLGSIYAIIALGYTMVYGIAKMLNFAHGDVIMIGCYVVFMTMSGMNMNPLVSVILAVVVCTVPVSYTHLDVYKRQRWDLALMCCCFSG